MSITKKCTLSEKPIAHIYDGEVRITAGKEVVISQEYILRHDLESNDVRVTWVPCKSGAAMRQEDLDETKENIISGFKKNQNINITHEKYRKNHSIL